MVAFNNIGVSKFVKTNAQWFQVRVIAMKQ
jgi:hypothetical protein